MKRTNLPEEQPQRANVLVRTGHALVGFYGRMLRDDEFTLAGSIAYTAILSVFPLLLVLIAILAEFIERADAQQTVVRTLAPYFPPSAQHALPGTLNQVA